jgi:hypothetical protein
MNSRSYATASAPDIVSRLRDMIDANETTRLLLDQGAAAFDAIRTHLDQTDAHIRQLIADLEGRPNG